MFEPIAGNDERTHYQTVMLIDPKGEVPADVVNAILGNRASFYKLLRERIHAEFIN